MKALKRVPRREYVFAQLTECYAFGTATRRCFVQCTWLWVNWHIDDPEGGITTFLFEPAE